MAIEYRLALAGDIPLERVAELAAPEATEARALPGYPRLLSADLNEECGYGVSIRAGTNGYYDAEDDDGSQWVWEPDTYVNITFRMRKFDRSEQDEPNMVTAVARVLAGRTEDAALVLNSNWLLLTRFEGRLRKRRLSWWDNYHVADLISDTA